MDFQINGWRGSNKVLELDGRVEIVRREAGVRELDETIWHGERVGLIGANGAGKSVLMRMILGQEAT